MDDVLNMWIDLDKLVPELRMVGDRDLRVPSHGNENGVDTARDWLGEDLAHLQPNHEGKGHDDRSEGPTLAVRKHKLTCVGQIEGDREKRQ